jgi:uncharacterized protein YqgQ
MKIKVRNQDPIEALDIELDEFLRAELSLKEQLGEICRLGKKYSVRLMKPLIGEKGKREVVIDIKYERLSEFFDVDELVNKYGSLEEGISRLKNKGYKVLSREE